MKKIFSIITAGIALLLAASCSMKEELVVLDPALCTPPTVDSYTVTDDGITVNFTPGTINVKAPAYHYLVLASLGGANQDEPLNSVEKDGVLTITNEALSKTLVNLGRADGDVVDLEMLVRISPQQKQTGNHSGYADSATKIPVNGFTVIVPKGSPYGDYTQSSPWTLIGSMSAYGINWDGDLNMWSNGTAHVAAHVNLKAGEEVKFRKDAGWAVNFGGDMPGLDTEFSVSQDGPNIKIDKDGVYDLYLYPESKKAMVTAAFDPYPEYTEVSTWSVIGSIASFDTGWGKDYPMITDGKVHVALGLTLAESDEFKFRKDAGWAVNFGGDFAELGTEFGVSQDGPNIKPALTGAYDLFLNADNATAWITDACGLKVSAKVAGEEPEPEPETVTGWNIIGLNGDWENDILATEDGDIWTAYITAEGDTEFKWRKDGDWAENYGGVMGAIGEPFEAVPGGDNIKIAAGFYKVVLDVANLTITLYDNVFSLIGEINGTGWDTDFELAEVAEGVYESDILYFGGNFKVRHNHSWADEDTYGTDGETVVGKVFTLVQPGNNIAVEAGNYKVRFTPETKEILITSVNYDLPEIDLSQFEVLDIMAGAETWGIIGPAVSDWSTDVDLQKIQDEPEIWAAMNVPFQKNSFKFRGNDTWGDYDLGGGTFALNTPIVMTKGGGDMTSERGVYTVFLYPTYGVAYLTEGQGDVPQPEKPEAWSLIGTVGGTNWDTDFDLANTNGDIWKISAVAITAADEFKLRADHDWGTNVGGTEANDHSTISEDNPYDVFKPEIGKAFATGGYNIHIGVEGVYDITFDYAASTILIEEYKEYPDRLYMIGQDFGGWDWNSDGVVEMTPVLHNPDWGADAEAQFWAVRYLKGGNEHGFKFNTQRAWGGDFWGLQQNEGFTEAGGNCTVAEDGVYLIFVDFKRAIVSVEPAKVMGIGECFGGWDGTPLEVNGDKVWAYITGTGEIRLYVDGNFVTSPWWTREFVFFDGKIAYRGAGGDQARVTVEAGSKVILDFNAGTAVVESASEPPYPDTDGITIDGDMSDWEGVTDQVASTKEEPVYMLFKVTNDDEYIYFYSKRDDKDAIWNRGGYIYYDIDADNNPETGVDKEIPGLEMWLYFFPFDAPGTIATDIGNGSAYPSKDVFKNFSFAGAVSEGFVEIEARLPLTDAGVKKGDVIAVYTWSNKSGDDLKKTPITYTVK